MTNKFKTIPLSLKAANDFVTNHHRHNKKTAGHKFSIGAPQIADSLIKNRWERLL